MGCVEAGHWNGDLQVLHLHTFCRRQNVLHRAVKYMGPTGGYEILLFQNIVKKLTSKQRLVL